MSRIKRKLSNNKGFSLTELLTALLVMGLLACFIGGGVVVVKNAYEKITLKAEAQTLLSTTMTSVMDDLRFATNIEGDSIDNLVFDSGSRGYRMSFYDTASDSDTINDADGICVKPAFDDDDGDDDVPLPIVTSKAQTHQLSTALTSLTYAEDKQTFTFIIKVYKLSDESTVIEREQTVRIMNAD